MRRSIINSPSLLYNGAVLTIHITAEDIDNYIAKLWRQIWCCQLGMIIMLVIHLDELTLWAAHLKPPDALRYNIINITLFCTFKDEIMLLMGW